MQLKQDWHIHTHRSLCGRPENTVPAIIRRLDDTGIEMAGISDHIDAPAQRDWFLDVIQKDRADLGILEPRCRVFVGTEASMLSPTRCALDAELAAQLDFVIVACNHYHLDVVENPSVNDAPSYASHYLDMVSGAIELGHADTISHPFILLKSGPVLATEVLKWYDEARLMEVLERAARANVAFEINPSFTRQAIEWFRDLVSEARRHGAKFTLGSDSHTLAGIGYPTDGAIMSPSNVCDAIGLTPADLKWL